MKRPDWKGQSAVLMLPPWLLTVLLWLQAAALLVLDALTPAGLSQDVPPGPAPFAWCVLAQLVLVVAWLLLRRLKAVPTLVAAPQPSFMHRIHTLAALLMTAAYWITVFPGPRPPFPGITAAVRELAHPDTFMVVSPLLALLCVLLLAVRMARIVDVSSEDPLPSAVVPAPAPELSLGTHPKVVTVQRDLEASLERAVAAQDPRWTYGARAALETDLPGTLRLWHVRGGDANDPEFLAALNDLRRIGTGDSLPAGLAWDAHRRFLAQRREPDGERRSADLHLGQPDHPSV